VTPLEGDIEGAGSAMAPIGLGDASDEGPHLGLGQPLRRPPPENAVAQRALSRNDEYGSVTLGAGSVEKGVERCARAVLIKTMQVEAGADDVPLPRQSPAAQGLDGMGFEGSIIMAVGL